MVIICRPTYSALIIKNDLTHRAGIPPMLDFLALLRNWRRSVSMGSCIAWEVAERRTIRNCPLASRLSFAELSG